MSINVTTDELTKDELSYIKVEDKRTLLHIIQNEGMCHLKATTCIECSVEPICKTTYNMYNKILTAYISIFGKDHDLLGILI